MKLKFWPFDLKLARAWAVSSNAASGGKDSFTVVFVELEDDQGRRGVGEAAPTNRYNESAETVEAFLKRVDPHRLSFANVAASMDYLESVSPGITPPRRRSISRCSTRQHDTLVNRFTIF